MKIFALISILFITPFALANESIIGEWESDSMVCGIPGYSSEGMATPKSTTILNSDGSFQVNVSIPHPSMKACSISTKGLYSITGSKIITEITSVKPDVDCLRALGISEETLKALELLLMGTQSNSELKTKQEKEFVLDGDILYSKHDLSDSFASIFCQAGETLYFKSVRKQQSAE